MGKLRDKIERIKKEKRAAMRKAINKNIGVAGDIKEEFIAELADLAQGAHDVVPSVSVERQKGAAAGTEATMATIVAGIAFAAVRKNINMDPYIENYVAGGIAVAVSSLFAYIKKRIANRRKMRAMEK